MTVTFKQVNIPANSLPTAFTPESVGIIGDTIFTAGIDCHCHQAHTPAGIGCHSPRLVKDISQQQIPVLRVTGWVDRQAFTVRVAPE